MRGFAEPVHFTLRRSRRLGAMLLAAHLLAGAWLVMAFPTGAARHLLCAAVALNALVLGYRRARIGAGDVAAVLLDSGDAWRVTLRDGRVAAATLVAHPLVTPALTCLSLRLDDGSLRHLALLDDNVAPDAHRRLRVRLRHPRAPRDRAAATR